MELKAHEERLANNVVLFLFTFMTKIAIALTPAEGEDTEINYSDRRQRENGFHLQRLQIPPAINYRVLWKLITE